MSSPQRDWAGLAALILSVGLAVGFAGALLLAASPFTDTISEGGVNLLNLLGGGIIAIIAAYVSRHGAANTGTDSQKEQPNV